MTDIYHRFNLEEQEEKPYKRWVFYLIAIFILLITLSSVKGLNLMDNLTSYLPLDSNYSSANGNYDALSSATIGTTNCRLNGCADLFTSPDTYIINWSDVPLGEVFTANMWLYCDKASTLYAFARTNGVLANPIQLIFNNDGNTQYMTDSGSGNDVVGKNPYYFPDESLFMLTIVYSDTDDYRHFYINGTIEDEDTTSFSGTDDTTKNLILNGRTGTIGGECYYDEVGLWARVLTDEEIEDLYNSGTGLGYPFIIENETAEEEEENNTTAFGSFANPTTTEEGFYFIIPILVLYIFFMVFGYHLITTGNYLYGIFIYSISFIFDLFLVFYFWYYYVNEKITGDNVYSYGIYALGIGLILWIFLKVFGFILIKGYRKLGLN